MGKRLLTKKEVIEEIIKCSNDPIYFLNTYGYVRHPKLGKTKLHLYDFQEKALREFIVNRFEIILKSRQLGLSTIAAGYIAWMITFFSGKEIVVVADKQTTAQNFIRKVKFFIKNLPDWLRPTIPIDNQGSIEMKNGSKVTAVATTHDAGRSEALSLLVIDEAAIIDSRKVDDLWAAAYPTLSLGGAGIIISTPKGVGNFYHKQWERAISKESNFNPLVLHWTMHPEYSLGLYYDDDGKPRSPWYDDQCKALGDPRKIAQELDTAFLGSGDNVVGEEYIKKAESVTGRPSRIAGFDNNLWVWEEPKDGEEYLIAADVARGDGGDYSAAVVFKLSNKEQVAEYKGKLPPDMYAKFLCELGKEYNTAMLVTEANSIGYATCLKIVEMEYPNIFYSLPHYFNARDRRKLEKAMRDQTNMVPGFQTTSVTKPLAIAQLEEEIRNGTFIIHSQRLISELRTLIWTNGKPGAMNGYNDDLCMASAIGLLVIQVALADMTNSKEATIYSLKSISMDSFDARDNPILNVGSEQWAKGPIANNPWVMIDRGGNEVDLTWLIKK